MSKLRVAVIGGGAAGFFAAISCKEYHPTAEVSILEKTQKYLSKVKVSGGGRCNVTHNCEYAAQLIKYYPRGGRWLKKAFTTFGAKDTYMWFEQRNVPLKIEEDGRVFPKSDDSSSIIDCLVDECLKKGIHIKIKHQVTQLKKTDSGFQIEINGTLRQEYDHVIIATGGSPKLSAYQWLKAIGHKIIDPIPSLFTFNMPKENVRNLMGVVAPNASVSIRGTKLNNSGPLLITHWGMSGPAILKLSSWSARELYELNYQFVCQVNWTHALKEAQLKDALLQGGNKQIKNYNPTDIPSRLWLHLLEKAELNETLSWQEQNKKAKNKLITILTNDQYQVTGKTTFKEEFVTCGGVDLSDINSLTMESKVCPGLYFAGEVMNIDAVTGGFNFQAAWTTGYLAGQLK